MTTPRTDGWNSPGEGGYPRGSGSRDRHDAGPTSGGDGGWEPHTGDVWAAHGGGPRAPREHSGQASDHGSWQAGNGGSYPRHGRQDLRDPGRDQGENGWGSRDYDGWGGRGDYGWPERDDHGRADRSDDDGRAGRREDDGWAGRRDDGWAGRRDDGWAGRDEDGRGAPDGGQRHRRPLTPRRRRSARRRGPVRRFLHRWRLPIIAVLATFSLIVGWSVVRALTMPGGGTVSERLAEWARDHYLGPIVTLGEWLSYQPPKKGGKAVLPDGPAAQVEARKKQHQVIAAPHRLALLARGTVKGQGIWRVLATVHGEPAIYGTYLVPSSVYSSYVSGIAWINQSLVKFELRPGTQDPGPGNWHAQPWIPPGTRRGLLATFNGGFRIASSGGGFYLNGSRFGTLTPGVASVVYYRDGHIKIGVWGRTVRMTPDVVGVRQNLHLIVIHGRIPGSVDQNVESSWGATLGGGYYVWRSGIGITKTGQIVFAYGPELNVREIAQLLQRAGAVTGMQLDINPDWMSFMYYLPRHHPNNPTPYNLLNTQTQAPNRYFSITGRDFTAVYAR